jgi:peroxiredoxin
MTVTLRNGLLVIIVSGLLLAACAVAQPQSRSKPLLTPAATVRPAGSQIRSTPRVLKIVGDTSPVIPDRDESDTSTPISNPAEAIRMLPKVGSLAPDFSLRTITGVTVTLSALRGHPVLINFWASWCVACRAEAPELQKVYIEYAKGGLIVLGVNATAQDTVPAAQTYVDEFRLTFPIPMDMQGTVMSAYQVAGLPTSFFIDRDGVIRDVIIGQMYRATMLDGLELIKPW